MDAMVKINERALEDFYSEREVTLKAYVNGEFAGQISAIGEMPEEDLYKLEAAVNETTTAQFYDDQPDYDLEAKYTEA